MPALERPALIRDLTTGPAGRLLREHVLPQTRWLLSAVLCMALYAAATAGQAWIMEPMLDHVFLQRDRAMLLLVPIAVIALALIKGSSGYGQVVFMARIGQRAIAGLQQRLFDHLVHTDLDYVVARGPGPLISRLTYDTQQLRLAVTSALTTVVRDALTMICLVGLMFHQSWQLAALALVGFPLALWPIQRLGRRMRKVARQSQTHMARLSGRLEQTFQGIRQVKADNRADHESERTGALIEQLFGLNYQAARVSAISSPTMEVIGGCAVAAVILFGGWQVLAGQTTPGAFFSFVAALLFAYRPLKTLANLHTQVQVGLAAAERIYTLLDREPAVRDRPGARPLAVTRGEIRFSGVRFGYRQGRPALRGLDLVIPAGLSVALVGPSGAGKSTMLNLILRFYDADQGAVLIDDQDVRGVTLASLRDAIALVSQDVDLFDDTVRANIAYGRPGADDAAIEAAARAAVAHDFICALPEGYASPIGPGGASLSGGQRQRLGIARAMLKDAPILLLDEATSALDSEAERTVQGALQRLMRGRTTVVIAHRLSTVMGADLIAVVEEGQVVETGTHRALLARGGSYARLYEQQFADQRSVATPVAAVDRRRA
ncbi:MAG TPA: ABC transporter transmembrane domain-containing protein [Geminicoccaceae bacterium]|nr:ABC transporter transmembrane domain-containing protein [Geminicoccaceae bacterium]